MNGKEEFEKWADENVGFLTPFNAWQARQPEIDALKAEVEKYRAINTPEIRDFILATEREAMHQRERWGNSHDAGKTDADWFWLIGYLAGKAIRPSATPDKQLHHIITAAAACLNWHAHKLGAFTNMRPGIDGAMKEPK